MRDMEGYEPPSYQPVKEGSSGKGRSVREWMAKKEASLTERDSAAARALDDRLNRSATRKLLNLFFMLAYITLGAWFLLGLVEQQGIIMPLVRVGMVFLMPFMWYRPEPDTVLVAGMLHVNKPVLLALVLYAVIHIVLLAIHKIVTVQRMYKPE